MAAALLALAAGCGDEQASVADGAPAASIQSQQSAPPNVLLITIDTLRADALGAYEPSLATSPNIDRLAGRGVLFESCLSAAPTTLPSHATILTGKFPFAHGARSNYGFVLADENVTLAERLREAGYETAAEIAAPVIGRRTRLDQGFDRYTDTESFEAKLHRVTKGDRDDQLVERAAADITRRGLEFLARKRDRPFFLWLHYFDPHVPYVQLAPYSERFPESPYLAEVARTDAEVGRLLDGLERAGLDQDTLVVLTSDHGEGLGEHGEQNHAYFVYDSTMQVPLIIAGPGVPRGRRLRGVVRTADIAPTVLGLLGKQPLREVQGASLAPYLADAPEPDSRIAYGESIEAHVTFGTSVLRFLREGDWKYIHKVNAELYDVESDPAERVNRAKSEPEVLASMRERLLEVMGDARSVSGATVPVDPEVAAQLQALGYVGAGSGSQIGPSLDSAELVGVDPSGVIDDVGRYAKAFSLYKHAHSEADYEAAKDLFAGLHERYPERVVFAQYLAISWMSLGRAELALPILQRATEQAPEDEDLWLMLAEAAQAAGQLDEAARALGRAASLEPCSQAPLIRYTDFLRNRGMYGEEIRRLSEALERCPADLGFRNNYAYALATAPDAALRDGEKALRLAVEITAGEGASNPAFLDTLAAAYAEQGDFGAATEASRRALELIESRKMPEAVVALFRGHLEELEAGRPLRAE